MTPNPTGRSAGARLVQPTRGNILTVEQKRGRLILLVSFGIILLFHLCLAGLILAFRIEPPVRAFVRLAFFFALMLGTYFGQNWAKWLLIGLALLAGASVTFDLVAQPSVIRGLLLLFCILPPAVLLFSKAVNSFLNSQGVDR